MVMDYNTFKRLYSELANCTLRDAKRDCDDFIATLIQVFEHHEGLKIQGFGTFELEYREPHMANIFGRQAMTKPQWKIVFKPSPAMMERVNKAEGDIPEEAVEADE